MLISSAVHPSNLRTVPPRRGWTAPQQVPCLGITRTRTIHVLRYECLSQQHHHTSCAMHQKNETAWPSPVPFLASFFSDIRDAPKIFTSCSMQNPLNPLNPM